MDLKDKLAAGWSWSQKALREELLEQQKRRELHAPAFGNEKRPCACLQLKVGGLGRTVGREALQSGRKK